VLGRKGRPSRFLAAVVFTDIAGSTEMAARLGDEAWKRLLERHLSMVRAALRRFSGREVDTAGDGVYATFESPAQAIAFALHVGEHAEALGIRLRSGVHMGEVELIGGKAGGIAVHIGARIAGLAEPGEVLVSGTVRDLAAGAGIGFHDRGTSQLKGVPGEWALFSARVLEAPAALPAERTAPARERMAARLRSRRWRIGIVVALIVVLVGSAIGANALLQPRYLPGVEANSVGRLDAGGNGIVSALQVGNIPDAIAFGEGSLWVTDTTAGRLSRIDPANSRIVQTIRVGGSPSALAVGQGAVWVANGIDGTVSRISPVTNEVISTIDVGNGPSGVAADDRWVWVTNRLDGTLSRVDPRGGGDDTTFTVGTTPSGVAVGAGAVWISDFDTSSVVRFDPATNASIARVHVGNGPTSIAAAAGQVWVVNSRDGTVSRIDPSTNAVVSTINVGSEPQAVAVAQAVWVTVGSSAEIVRIDPSTNSIVKRISVQSRPRDIAVAGGEPWFTARAAPGTHRGGTLHIVGDSGFAPASYEPTDLSLTDVFSLTNDGLVAFKRVGGSDGLTLVADLATSIPAPTDGGTTYTFQLRKGITYSTGAPVRAVDVRSSIERFFVLNKEAVGVFGTIEGAEACEGGPETCDLSASIIVNDEVGTVSFRLREADTEFLYKLAVPQAVVLPADTPRAPATAPLPATGPYMAQPFDADGSLRLIRNPTFREWSHEAQPDGFPDEIQWRVTPDQDEAVSLVAAGEADYAARVPAERAIELSTRFTDQLHALPSTRTFFEFMNTTIPPFNNLDVRRAVNLATDRARVVEANGGPLLGRETCQQTPPGFPGYEPYCPYSASPGGAWRAPDMTAARALIDGAGVRGTKVTIRALDVPEHQAIGRYFVELLNDLGFVASLTPITIEEIFGIEDPFSAGIQMLGLWFLPSYPAASSLILGSFTCPDFKVLPGSPGNFAGFCDPDIDARALGAYNLQATDPSAANLAWAEVDRLITDQSPAVAAFNPVDLTFHSKRVGNVQLNPVLGLLLSQVWVQ
jgi:peptide/nickel transport system substrate-binding protein